MQVVCAGVAIYLAVRAKKAKDNVYHSEYEDGIGAPGKYK